MNCLELKDLEFSKVGIFGANKIDAFKSEKDYFCVTTKGNIFKILGIQILYKSTGNGELYICNTNDQKYTYEDSELLLSFEIKYVFNSLEEAKKALLIQ